LASRQTTAFPVYRSGGQFGDQSEKLCEPQGLRTLLVFDRAREVIRPAAKARFPG
jgi:hypothetical protein